jgi:hypothetical protein
VFDRPGVAAHNATGAAVMVAGAALSETINIGGGTYGNTFHVTAVKRSRGFTQVAAPAAQDAGLFCDGFFERAADRISAFERYYHEHKPPNCYVPLRCIPYLACVGDFGQSRVFDSNVAWLDKYIDGYGAPIGGVEDIAYSPGQRFFVASLTFFKEIRTMLLTKGYPEDAVKSIEDLP